MSKYSYLKDKLVEIKDEIDWEGNGNLDIHLKDVLDILYEVVGEMENLKEEVGND